MGFKLLGDPLISRNLRISLFSNIRFLRITFHSLAFFTCDTSSHLSHSYATFGMCHVITGEIITKNANFCNFIFLKYHFLLILAHFRQLQPTNICVFSVRTFSCVSCFCDVITKQVITNKPLLMVHCTSHNFFVSSFPCFSQTSTILLCDTSLSSCHCTAYM